MIYEAEGFIAKIFPTESKGASNFLIRIFVLEVKDGNNVELIKFKLIGGMIKEIDSFTEGEQIKVYFKLQGREWQGNYLNSLLATGIKEIM